MTLGKTQIVPPLEGGDSPLETIRDRLSRHEFEHRYQAASDIKKAGLVSLENGSYISLQPNEKGVIQSLVFPCLWLVPALLTGNMAAALAVRQQGLNSLEQLNL